ncbi:hypothetical protein RQP46_004193 [Phenoliferia psychrophenolica]
MKFLLVCSQNLDEFRLPELESIAALFNFKIRYEGVPDVTRPYMIVDLDSEREALLLGSRAICVKHIWEHWADALTYEELQPKIKALPELYESIASSASTTWKFKVGSFGQIIPIKEQIEVINSFGWMSFKGDISLKKPMVELGVFEEYVHATTSQDKGRILSEMRRVWMGRKVCDTQRHMIDTFDVKKRAYIGNTTMESEVSLLMANQALASKGKLVYDPFTGTGSMLLTSSAFGAMSFGSDIDGRQMRGKKTSLANSAAQYGVTDKILDCAAFDLTQHPFRTGEIFDAIVTDPPYGVRAGAKRLGRKDNRIEPYVPALIPGRESEGMPHKMEDYVPPTHPWEMEDVIRSLITFSLYLLKPGGRLVFFLPTDNAEYADVDIPVVDGLKLISNSSQDFGKWSRRLITMEKVGSGHSALDGLDRGIARMSLGGEDDGPTDEASAVEESKRPGHANFGRKFLSGFRE